MYIAWGTNGLVYPCPGPFYVTKAQLLMLLRHVNKLSCSINICLPLQHFFSHFFLDFVLFDLFLFWLLCNKISVFITIKLKKKKKKTWSLCPCSFSFSIMFLRFIYASSIYWDFISLYGWIISHCIHASYFFYRFIIWWILGLYPLFSSCTSFCVDMWFHFSCISVRMRLLGQTINLCSFFFLFWGTIRIFAKVDVVFHFPSAVYEGSNFSISFSAHYHLFLLEPS